MGMFSGYAARRLTASRPAISPAPTVPVREGRSSGETIENTTVAPNSKSPAIEAHHVRSSDTVETLAAIKDGTLYSRLAAWMIDASETDIAAYWNSYHKGERRNDITDLVFINWTRLNPQGAIAAVSGGKDEHYAWWAWAAHDPKGALSAAIAANPDRVNNVAWGIGEFDPQWLRDHFDQIPESARGNAMQGFSKWDDGANPLDSLKFMKEYDVDFDQGTFKALVNQDPWAAFDWIKENPSLQSDRYGNGSNAMDILLSAMGREHPDDLARLAAQTPSGTLKRKMEATLFDNLLSTDPSAALEKAKTTDVPLIAVERFGKIGLPLVKTDPEKAFEMAEAIFKASPEKLEAQTKVEFKNGWTSWGGEEGPASELLSALLNQNPVRVLDLFSTSGGDETNPSQTFSKLSQQWATQDLVGFSNWVNTQNKPEIRDTGVNVVMYRLMEDGQFNEAIDWGMSSEKLRSNGSLNNIIHQWKESDPVAAAEWLEAADMTEDEKSRYQAIINPQPKTH